MADLETFVSRADAAEKEVEKLIRELESLEPKIAEAAAVRGGDEGEIPEELLKLRSENVKLKYRLGILQRATDAELAKKGSSGGGTSSKMAKPAKVSINAMPVFAIVPTNDHLF